MAEKCTNTSSPVERWMNPYPFAPLNHFTVPFSLTASTPFTIVKNYSPAFSIVAPVDWKPPSKTPVEVRLRLCRAEEVRQKRKDSAILAAVKFRCVNFGARQFDAFPPHYKTLTALPGLATGPLPGNEPPIIR